MSGGLLALLDDIVALTKLTAATLDDAAAQAAQAGAKAAGVVIDDAAVTPRYVVGIAAERELPIVGKIALGSLKNKLIYLLPAALLLTAFAPWAITPLLMLGGLFLCFEGYEKVAHALLPHESDSHEDKPASEAPNDPKSLEDAKVAGAIRTDLILSAEIMAIAVASITAPSFLMQAIVLFLVAIMITAGVYGVVALIVKADDLGLHLAQKGGPVMRRVGRALVYGMPPFLKLLSVVGTIAMLWVGGGILVHGLAHFGITAPEHLIFAVTDALGGASGTVLAWLVNATVSAVVGVIAGVIVALLLKVLRPLARVFH